MKVRYRTLTWAVACVATMLAGGQRAAAESVSLQFNTAVNGGVSLNGDPSGPYTPSGPFYWTENGHPSNGNFLSPTVTFCIESGGALPAPNASAIFGVYSLADTPSIGPADATAVTELYGRFYNTAWDSASFTGSDASISFQIALWELVKDGTPAVGSTTSLTTGSFTASPSLGSLYTTANSYLSQLTGDTSSFATRFSDRELVSLLAPDPNGPKTQDYQDQITMRPKAVPAPPGLVLAGIGFVGLVGRGRWLRRKAAAV